jgi:voltage-gated potassium channel
VVPSEISSPASSGPSPTSIVLHRLRPPLIAAVVLFTLSTLGYVVIADLDWFDAVYMTVITLSTIGYGEVTPLDTVGRLWTIAVILAGFGIVVYVTASLTSLFLSGDVQQAVRSKRRMKMRDTLEDHLIVVGFGRVGRATVAATVTSGRQCAVIDDDPDRADDVTASGAVLVPGDARDLDVLRQAHIDKAVALVSAIDDPENLVVLLSARALCPDLRVVVRVNDVTWRDRLVRAGASAVIPVYESAGASLAASALTSDVMGVQDLPTLGVRTEELVVPSGSKVIGWDLTHLGATTPEIAMLGVRRDDRLARWNEITDGISAGDVLVALGPADSLARLAGLVSEPG